MKPVEAGNADKSEKPAFLGSLLFRYMMIVVLALFFIPAVLVAVSVFYAVVNGPVQPELKYGNSQQVKSDWDAEAGKLDASNPEIVNERLRELKLRYEDASMFWVDGTGRTRLQLPEQAGLPLSWTADDTVRFMKQSVNGDPYTVVSFLGADGAGPGFMVLQLPRTFLRADSPVDMMAPTFFGLVLLIFLVFVLLSWLFFRNIRQRLLRLQSAMTATDGDGIPVPIVLSKRDEIGKLEQAFNGMAERLRVGREREREEEKLRKQLIGSLSHDLRTPLTVMRSHVHLLGREALSPQGEESVRQLEAKTERLGGLIDNLFAYTLMTSGKYPLKLEVCDIARLVRQGAATWYPLWEKEGIEPEVDLPEVPIRWEVDKEGFLRILDNLFQNVVRHARSGGWIGISARTLDSGAFALVISDRGPGMSAISAAKGGGIGLAIVDYLLREMKLSSRVESGETGTRIAIWPRDMQL